MGKKSTSKKRGIQRGAAKHKIRSKLLTGKDSKRTVLGITASVYFSIGRKCFEFLLHGCGKLYLAPFTPTASGEYVPLDRKARLMHYFIWFLNFLTFLHKLGGLVTSLLQEDVNIETFMGTSVFVAYLAALCLSLSMIARPRETIDLLNSWPYILSCLKEVQSDVPSEFDDMSATLKLIALLAVTQGLAVGLALVSLPFSRLPTCVFPTAERLCMIPKGLLPRYAWQLVFLPIEYATHLPFMLSAAFAGSFILILVGVSRIYGNALR